MLPTLWSSEPWRVAGGAVPGFPWHLLGVPLSHLHGTLGSGWHSRVGCLGLLGTLGVLLPLGLWLALLISPAVLPSAAHIPSDLGQS